MKRSDPLADFPDWVWATLADYTGASITQVRATLKVYLAALESIGYELKSTGSERDWAKAADVVSTVLGDVASDRDMGVAISFEEEVDQVVTAVREVLS
jgi:hypothetical protein